MVDSGLDARVNFWATDRAPVDDAQEICRQSDVLVVRLHESAENLRAIRLRVRANLAEGRRQLELLRGRMAAVPAGPVEAAIPARPAGSSGGLRTVPTSTSTSTPKSTDDDLVLDHIGLAYSLAGRYATRGEEIDDLRQVAMLGLVKASHRFDPDRGVKFSTFATTYIVGEIKRHFRDKRWGVHVPRADQEAYLRVRDAADGLSTILGRSPTVEEIAEHARVSTEQVLLSQELSTMFELSSLDAMQASDGSSRTDVGEKDNTFDLIEWRVNLTPALEALDSTSRDLIRLRFRDGLSQSEIGQRLGVSQMQVSRMLSSTLAVLRAKVGA